MIDFKGSHFERDIILCGVRWYVAYPISYRQLEEMMSERGVEVDHSSLEVNVGAIEQRLDAYDQDAVTAGVSLNRKFSDLWSGSVGVSAEQERILQEMVTRDYTLLGIPVNAKYNSTGVMSKKWNRHIQAASRK